MRQVVDPDDDGAEEGAGELHGGVRDDLAEVTGRHRGAERHGGIEMGVGAAASDRRHHSGEDCEPPAGGDGEPSGVLAFGSLQQHAGDDAVAEQYQDERPEKLSKKR